VNVYKEHRVNNIHQYELCRPMSNPTNPVYVWGALPPAPLDLIQIFCLCGE